MSEALMKPQSTIQHKKKLYINSLDGIRAISMIIVLLSHSGFGHIVPGGLGVTIFFFLSGYLITTLSLFEFQKNKTLNLKRFYFRRLIRLYPALIVALILIYSLCYFKILPGEISFKGIFFQLTYFSNYMLFLNNPIAKPDGTTILWSLAVEAHFYTIYPILFSAFLKKYSKKDFIKLLSFICILVLIWRCALIYKGATSDRIYYCTDTRIDAILFGCILALSKYNPLLPSEKSNDNESPNMMLILLLLILPLIVFVFSLVFRHPFFRATLRYSLQSLVLIPLFWLSIKYYDLLIFRPLNSYVLKRIGQLSYTIYLTHFSIISILISTFNFSNRILIFFTSLSSSLLLAYFVEQFIEKPIGKLKNRV